MEDWLTSLKSGSDIRNVLSGQHTWHATSHARPTYCNVCREQLSGVTSHGLSCEICKYKAHKRCALKAVSNCKWTTLASVGKDIIEDKHGNILMSHQWMEGNLPVYAKCPICDKTCGSVLRLQDWRCLWCRATVHTACRPKHSNVCPLGPNRVSVVPPTAIHSVGTDDAWEAVRPQGCSPLLVFVNSKSGDNQGVKFLRRFRQILNPAQVFDLIANGPGLGLRLFRHFDPFRVLICSGDGSVGWVLSEIDRLNMQIQCEVGVLPLGTGNDLARVLGWGASCDDDTQVPQLLERYERASPKILDRWSVMVFERSLKLCDDGKLTLDASLVESNNILTTAVAYEDSVLSHLTNILQSDQHSIVISSAKVLCETVKDFSSKISEVSLVQGDTDFSEKCQQLKAKLDHLLQVLHEEQQQADSALFEDTKFQLPKSGDEKHSHDTREKLVIEPKKQRKDQLLLRVNSLKRAVRRIVEHTERAVDEQSLNYHSSFPFPSSPGSRSASSRSTTIKESGISENLLSPLTPSSIIPNVTSISPLPDFRRDSSCSAEINLESLPVPSEFADSRHGSFAETEKKRNSVTFVYESGKSTFEQLKNSIKLTEEWVNNKRSTRFLDYDNENEDKSISEDKSIGEDKSMDEDKSIGEDKSINEDKSICAHKSALENKSLYTDNKLISAIDEKETSFDEDDEYFEKFTAEQLSFEITEDLLANIGHIDSSETSDDSPESSTTNNKKEELPKQSACKFNRSSLRGSVKESEHSFPISIDGICAFGSELDMTNLFSTSPEDEECSEEYRREMGLIETSIKRCSIAHFIEGSDIAQRSIKCKHRQKSMDELEMECVAVTQKSEIKQRSLDTLEKRTRQTLQIPSIHVSLENGSDLCSNILQKDLINLRIKGSHNNLASSTDGIFLTDKSESIPGRISYALSETDDEEYLKFEGLTRSGTIANSSSTGPTVIIDPPSPPEITDDDTADIDEKPSREHIQRFSESCRRLSAASPLSLHCSPSPSRRISNFSLFQSDSIEQPKDFQPSKNCQKKLPIINPLVRLPQWPNVSEPGIIGKVLLANADALCAAAVPLMDPDEAVMEGFFERCVMNNYFGIGIDAKISLDFHHKREEHPEKCRSRTRNYMWYGVLGSKQWLQKTYKNLEQRVQLECDGHRIPLPSLQGIVVLNIPSFMGGINFWGGSKEDDIFLAPSIDDHILEVVAVFGTVQMAASRLINLQHHRIAQCTTVQINIMGDEGVPIQVDGEAWIQPPGMIRIIHKNRVKMLCRNKNLESSLKAWEEKQREKRQNNRLHSTIAKTLSIFGEEEYGLLLGFIEATAALIKCVKLLIIRHPQIEADLYELAATVGINMERVHPSGKLLPGLELRPVVSDLVLSAQKLHDETNLLLRDKTLQIATDVESQLNVALIQMESELKKCVFIESSPQHSLVYLRMTSPDDQEKKQGHRRGSTFWQRFRRGSGVSTAKHTKKEVSSWGVSEVGNWLDSLQLSEYVEAFASHDVRGRELLTLTRRDLKELGITKVGHVKRILLALKEIGS